MNDLVMSTCPEAAAPYLGMVMINGSRWLVWEFIGSDTLEAVLLKYPLAPPPHRRQPPASPIYHSGLRMWQPLFIRLLTEIDHSAGAPKLGASHPSRPPSGTTPLWRATKSRCGSLSTSSPSSCSSVASPSRWRAWRTGSWLLKTYLYAKVHIFKGCAGQFCAPGDTFVESSYFEGGRWGRRTFALGKERAQNLQCAPHAQP